MSVKYIHPKEYSGLRFNTPNNQKIHKSFVEANCLKCDRFCGKEHDFAECSIPQDCPKPVRYPSVIDPVIMYESESAE